MALAIDASTPANTTGTTRALTTASFTPPSGSLLVLLFSANDGVGSNNVSLSTVTNTGPTITWTRAVLKAGSVAGSLGGAGQPGTAEIWVGTGANGTACTVTATSTDTITGTGHEKDLQIQVLTGAGSTLTNVAAASSASGLPSVAVPSCSVGSYVFAVSSDWAAKGNATAGTGQTIISQFNSAGQISLHNWRTTSALASAGSQTMNQTAPSAQQYNAVALEVPAAASGSSFTGSASLSGSGALTNAGTPAPAASQSLSGSGTVTGAGTPATSGSESGTGAGSLTLGAVPGFSGPFSPSGSGTLSLSGMAVYVGSAALSGAGTVTLGGTPKAINSTAPSGAGTLALGGTPTPTGSAPLTGSGTLSLSGTVGGGGPVAYSGLVMLTGDGGLSGSGAPAPTGTLSLGGAGFITLSAAGRTMYQFDPPGKQLSMDPTGRDFLWSKVKFFRGDAVVRYTSGAFKQVTTHDPDENGIDKVYLGGHSYVIDDGTAAELIQAGYGPYLKVVTS